MVRSNIILYQHVQNYPRTLFCFLSIIVKSTPVFAVFSVGRNEHKFLIYLRATVLTCNILI